ncbi:hypothetical protein Z945_2342 [Sulfitobacter noctilucae]|nr:hypothetical protein Z945_2342 [Sulfitobacter noctilucae]
MPRNLSFFVKIMTVAPNRVNLAGAGAQPRDKSAKMRP